MNKGAKRLVLGLTGGIACGKSTVANWLIEQGAQLINADQLGHQVLEPDGEAYDHVRSAFGSGIVTDSVNKQGVIDRKALGAIVFADSHALSLLNAITHPPIFQRLVKQVQQFQQQSAVEKPAVMVIEAAILLEVGWQGLCDVVWTVEAPIDVVIQRLMMRNQLDATQARQRVESQYPAERRKAMVNQVICNQGDIETLTQQLQHCWTELIKS